MTKQSGKTNQTNRTACGKRPVQNAPHNVENAIRSLEREVQFMKQTQIESIKVIKQLDCRLVTLNHHNLRVIEELKAFVHQAKVVLSTKIEELFTVRNSLRELLINSGFRRGQTSCTIGMSHSHEALVRSASSTPINRVASRGFKGT